MWKEAIILLVAAFIHESQQSGSQVTQAEDGSSGSIKFTTPTLSDDESHSPWMPDQLKCDACQVISYQLFTAFEKFNNARKSLKYKLSESDVLGLFEPICEGKAMDSYGIKEVNKVKRLSGPGLDTADVPGIMQGGGKWPTRLKDMCEQFAGELGEMEIYKVYARKPKSRKNLENYMCRGKGLRGDCAKAEKAAEEAARKKREEL